MITTKQVSQKISLLICKINYFHFEKSSKERFEKLVLQRSHSGTLSEVHRRCIAAKFATKSLEELYDIVCQLDNNIIPL